MKKRILGFLNHSQILSLFSFFIISILNTHTFLRYFFKSSMIFEIKNSIICCTNFDTKIPQHEDILNPNFFYSFRARKSPSNV